MRSRNLFPLPDALVTASSWAMGVDSCAFATSASATSTTSASTFADGPMAARAGGRVCPVRDSQVLKNAGGSAELAKFFEVRR